jgi:hypothetical protein
MSTTFLISLGGFPVNLATVIVIVTGVGISTINFNAGGTVETPFDRPSELE